MPVDASSGFYKTLRYKVVDFFEKDQQHAVMDFGYEMYKDIHKDLEEY